MRRSMLEPVFKAAPIIPPYPLSWSRQTENMSWAVISETSMDNCATASFVSTQTVPSTVHLPPDRDLRYQTGKPPAVAYQALSRSTLCLMAIFWCRTHSTSSTAKQQEAPLFCDQTAPESPLSKERC